MSIMQHHQHQQQHQHPHHHRQEHQQHHQHHPQQQQHHPQQQQHHPQQQQQQSHHHQQAQQPDQQQQQQQGFMADSEPWLSEDGQDELMPKIVQRRAKRIIPDTEKDDKYWEKRKRNNLAAKRSRENKRIMENDIRHKVSFLEEQNALLRKEISLIKARYGIPADQSLLTPEERAQCMQEVKSSQEAQYEARLKESSSGSPDDVSSTSPNVFPVGMSHQQHGEEEEDSNDRRINAEGSSSSPKLKDEGLGTGSGNDSVYGPSAYGPFNPSPSWGPTGPSGMPDGYGGGNLGGNGNSPGAGNPAAFSPQPGAQTKLPPISNAFQEKNNSPYSRYVNGGIMGYGRPHYDYFMQYASQNNPMLYGSGDMNHPGGIAPADLSTSRNKRTDERGAGRGVGIRDIMGGKNPELPENMGAHSIANSVAPSLELDDVAVMASSLGQVSRNQEQFPASRGMGLPVQMPGLSTTGQSLPAETAHTGSNGGIGGPDQENLKRENDALKMAVRSLTAQVEHMKDQAYKD